MNLRFHVLGIPVTVTPMFWLVSLLIASGRSAHPMLLLEWVVVVLASILVHELGHAAVVVAMGEKPWIELHGMGGSAYAPNSQTWKGWQRVALALAGPFAGVGFGLLLIVGIAITSAAGIPIEGTATVVLDDLLWINLGYGLLNLVPILPLDGGHVLREIVDGITGVKGHPATNVVSFVIAAIVVVASFAFGQPVLAFLVGWVAIRQVQMLRHNVQRRKDAEIQPRIDALVAKLNGNDVSILQDLAAIQDLRAKAKSPDNLANLGILEVVVLTDLGRAEEAAARVDEIGWDAFQPAVKASIALHLKDPEARDAWFGRILQGTATPADVLVRYLASVAREDRWDEVQSTLDSPSGKALTADHLLWTANSVREMGGSAMATGRLLREAEARSASLAVAMHQAFDAAWFEDVDRAATWVGKAVDRDPRAAPEAFTRATVWSWLSVELERHGRDEANVALLKHQEALGEGTPFSAFNLACLTARAGDVAGAWPHLEQAVARGWSELDTLEADADLAPLREDPRYASLRGEVAARAS